MIILDTNVVSEPLRAQPNTEVLTWLDAQHPQSLFLTSISVAELLAGVQLLPRGRRRNELQRAVDDVIALFEGQVLDFDLDAANAFASIHASTTAAGRKMNFADAAIAAIAAARGMSVATRNVKDFDRAGVELINPWKSMA
ncbi:type II toxin-antitoxin system VapC family toxin [Roseateles terrae]|uniref:Ribonuclease VapC n=1 Tax=Roseateles terrae TaxID=431060 RepID=A0ABR6GPC2_9BURK|nr:type II toxin-antitoxin system VapC family toxin [Roseateles terrae]MBB3193542.1 hypothetical protein [Roseateles terrae]OWQ89288.1 VapC toxin family PIN domain ribonuclease [Roseateles terrae]